MLVLMLCVCCSYGAEVLTQPVGFAFCWAGARTDYGVTSGKVLVFLLTFFTCLYDNVIFTVISSDLYTNTHALCCCRVGASFIFSL